MSAWNRQGTTAGIMLSAFLAAIVTIGGVFVASQYAEASTNKRVQRDCKRDYKKLCPRYRVGSTRLRACMEAKASQISSRCVDALIDTGEINRSSRRRRR